jgi:hypothetical protein
MPLVMKIKGLTGQQEVQEGWSNSKAETKGRNIHFDNGADY